MQNIKKQLEAAKARYLELEATALPEDRYAAHCAVKALQKQLSDSIAEGAQPCPLCGGVAIGIEQPGTFEVGCPACPPVEHSDGTKRCVAARGGLMPKHTVEAWNAG